MTDDNKRSAKKIFQKLNENDSLFRRADKFHQMLMEDFRFMEAARTFSGEYESAMLNTDDLTPRERFRDLIVSNPHALVNFATYSSKPQTEDKEDLKTKVYKADIRSLRFQTRMAQYPPLDIWAHWVLSTRVFQAIMVLVIVINSVLIAWDQEMSLAEEYRQVRRIFEAIDFFFLCLFVSEIVLKWLDDFHEFWLDGWNVFDFLCTVASLIPPMLDIIYPGDGRESEESKGNLLGFVKYLRIIRIFRSLNVVTRIHKIQIIWETVLKTFSELISITCLMAIFFYIYAIIGINTFDRFTESHRPNLRYRDAFASIPKAFIHLFLIFTVDQYELVIRSLAKVTGFFVTLLYSMTWILLAGFIFQNIFTGVMVNNFQNIRESLIEESSEMQQHRRLAQNLTFDEDEDEENERNDVHMAWEKDMFQNLQILTALGDHLTPTIWPRDTLFQYYILLESLASSVDERNYILKQLDQALVRHMDP